jgi:hypothetical protein
MRSRILRSSHWTSNSGQGWPFRTRARHTFGLHSLQIYVSQFWTTQFPRIHYRAVTTGFVNHSRLSRKMWLNSEVHPLNRAASFVELATINPRDFASRKVEQLVIDCCKLNSLEGLQAAEDIADRLLLEKRRMKARGLKIVVPAKIWQKIIYGWAVLAGRHRVAQFRIKELVKRVEAEAVKDRAEFSLPEHSINTSNRRTILSEPAVDMYNTVLLGIANASRLSKTSATEVDSVLDYMVRLNEKFGWHTKPNTRSYTNAISAYAQSGGLGDGDRAMAVLQRMKKAQQTEKYLYEEQYGVLYKFDDESSNKRKIVTTDTVVYTVAMKAITRSGAHPEKALDLLREVTECEGGPANADALLFASAIAAFRRYVTKCSDVSERRKLAKGSEEVLRMMLQYETISTDLSDGARGAFNACLAVWAGSALPESPLRCREIIQSMIEHRIGPDTISLNTCLHAWLKASRFHRNATKSAVELLFSHVSLATTNPKSSIADFQSYALVIRVLVSARGDPTRLVQARELLQNLINEVNLGRMKTAEKSPAPFTAVLIVASEMPSLAKVSSLDTEVFQRDDSILEQDAFSIACRTWDELKDDRFGLGIAPDHHAYSAFLKCIKRHCPENSSEQSFRVRSIFSDACETGHVSKLVLKVLERFSNWQNIIGVEKGTKVRGLPNFWWRNVAKEWID